jgi:glycosyltransferase involved in cell wall biosynthesis
MAKRIAVLVSNDLNHDQRVLKTCATLAAEGWKPILIGREMPESKPLEVPFEAHRMRLPFQRGAWFYASLQLGLLRALKRARVDAVWANDLDTLLPAFMVSRAQGLPLVYDSHEYFTEAAGLTGRPFQRGVWLRLERAIFPRLAAVITVNDGIADAYLERYPNARGGRPLVVRNMPRKRTQEVEKSERWRQRLGIPEHAPFLILQGAYLDKDRGVVQAVNALREQASWYLVVVGAGEEWEWAQTQVDALEGRLIVLPKMPFDALCGLTASADVGLSLDQGVHGNYVMSLPNKLFDYIHAGIPVVASPIAEVTRIIEWWGIGHVVQDSTPEGIAAAVEVVLAQPRTQWQSVCSKAAHALHWEAEEANIVQALNQAQSAG